MESLLLLFSSEHPCWDVETVHLTENDPDNLERLVSSGNLRPLGGGYVLTEQGIKKRERVSRELCVPVDAIKKIITDEITAHDALEVNRMAQYLDRAFMTHWSVKEIKISEKFPVVPCLPDEDYFKLEDGKVRAIWQELPLIKSFKETFPHCDFEARQLPPPGQAGLDLWAKEHDAPHGELTVDFVLRHHHDFNHYKHYAPLPSDIFGFLNTSLIMAQKVRGRAEDLLPFIGKIHIFFMEQRRIYAPGWFDMDCEQQETWKLITFVTDTEMQLQELTRTMRGWGYDLIEPARPMFIIGTSIERMRKQKEPKDVFYDWFQEETVRILRPDVPDND